MLSRKMQGNIFYLFLIVCLSVSTYCYTDCGSEVGTIASVDISGCSGAAKRCTLKRNTSATMELSFTPSTDGTEVKAVVHGIILGVALPFELPNSNGCDKSGLTCPLKAGQTYKYTTTMPILSSYPRVTVDIKWELRDQDDKDFVCAIIPSKIS